MAYSKKERAIKALNACIRHWQGLSQGKRRKMRGNTGHLSLEIIGSAHCECCRVYDMACHLCPVGQFNHSRGAPFSCGREYINAEAAYKNKGIDSAMFKNAAKLEVIHLQRVLKYTSAI